MVCGDHGCGAPNLLGHQCGGDNPVTGRPELWGIDPQAMRVTQGVGAPEEQPPALKEQGRVVPLPVLAQPRAWLCPAAVTLTLALTKLSGLSQQRRLCK